MDEVRRQRFDKPVAQCSVQSGILEAHRGERPSAPPTLPGEDYVAPRANLEATQSWT
ncbi:hypothetical protein CELD12_21730 [Cellulomonas sp. NTE-D12]|nr:hypothetical protein CELD12_21730 [Cellulomonas sp. NTE-D12]